jgi:hypothetical protein
MASPHRKKEFGLTMSSKFAICTTVILAMASSACTQESDSDRVGDANPPSRHTIAHQEALRDRLPFDDQRDFEEQSRGFIAAPSYRRIDDESGITATPGNAEYELRPLRGCAGEDLPGSRLRSVEHDTDTR